MRAMRKMSQESSSANMSDQSPDEMTPVVPTKLESDLARQTAPHLMDLLKRSNVDLNLHSDDQPAISLKLPAAAVRLLSDILHEMAQGHAVSVTSLSDDLTIDQAAIVLNTPCERVEDLMRMGELQFRGRDDSRRISRLDVLKCKRHIREQRNQALGELVAEAQELKLGY
jgi:hypothetical protein